MPAYRVMVHGRNFLLDVEGKKLRHGFFQTVFVEASDPTQAELDAISQVKASSDLQGLVQNDKSDPPMLFVDEIIEIKAVDLPPAPVRGRSFYVEDNQRRKINWYRAIGVAAAAAVAYAVLLRGAIEFLHPKLGWLLTMANAAGGQRMVDWTMINVSGPAYEFLVHVAWPSVFEVGVVIGTLAGAITVFRGSDSAPT